MRFREIDDLLPNGFHDAVLKRLSLDYGTKSAALEMEFWTETPEGSAEEYRAGVLVVSGLILCSIDPPDPDCMKSRTTVLTVSGNGQVDDVVIPDSLRAIIPIEATAVRFFVHDWNSFIHVIATSVELVW